MLLDASCDPGISVRLWVQRSRTRAHLFDSLDPVMSHKVRFIESIDIGLFQQLGNTAVSCLDMLISN